MHCAVYSAVWGDMWHVVHSNIVSSVLFCSVLLCGIMVLGTVCGGFRIESRLVFCVVCGEVCVVCGEVCVMCGTCVHESRYSHHGHSRPRHYSVHQMSLNCADNR